MHLADAGRTEKPMRMRIYIAPNKERPLNLKLLAIANKIFPSGFICFFPF
jgi:hypothetical protein